MKEEIDGVLRDLCSSLYGLCMQCLRCSQYLVLGLGICLIIGGALRLALSNSIGWVLIVFGLLVVGFNLGTWRLVRESTQTPPEE